MRPLYAFYTRCRDALVVILKHNACKKGTPTSPVILAQLLPCVSPPMSNVILAHSSLLCFLDRLLSYMKNLCPNFFATNNGIPSRYLVFSHADPQMLINIFRITSFMHFFLLISSFWWFVSFSNTPCACLDSVIGISNTTSIFRSISWPVIR